jgi:hypothetical protein
VKPLPNFASQKKRDKETKDDRLDDLRHSLSAMICYV